jgi:hypothetical protein
VNELIESVSQPSGEPRDIADARGLPDDGSTILCVAGRGAIDQAASILLAHLLDQSGLKAQLGPEQGLKGIASLVPSGDIPAAIFVSYVGTARVSHARFMVNRLRRRFPLAKIHLAVWHLPPLAAAWQELKNELPGVLFVSTMKEAAVACLPPGQQRPEEIAQPTGIAVTGSKLQNGTGPRGRETTLAAQEG